MPRNLTSRLVLALNAGSSSLKFALFDGGESARVTDGVFDRIGLEGMRFTLRDRSRSHSEPMAIAATDPIGCLDFLLERFAHGGYTAFGGVGHRVVHGGTRYGPPQRVTAAMVNELRQIVPFAPEHLPPEIALITAMGERFPTLPQVACFDTAFHRTLPRVARLLPIPRRYEAAGVRRYGFHGLSYEFLMAELGRLDPNASQGRVILAHLGNGASLAAVRDGASLDTSMAFTPAAGLMMGRRSGDLDPGLAAFFAQHEDMTTEQFHHLVNHQSGLLGVSEISSDMRELLAREATDARAHDAVEMFCYQTKKWLGSFTAALGGLDTLVFSGGIGENSPSIRSRICAGLEFLGIDIDAAANRENAALISNASGRVRVRVIHTEEERTIARAVYRVLGLGTQAEETTES